MVRVSSFSQKYRIIISILLFSPITLLNVAFAAVNSPMVVAAHGGNGVPITVNNFDNVDAIGYDVSEYFVSGDAHQFLHRPFTLKYSGKWDAISPSKKTEPYQTRVLVYSPKDMSRFNGTVYIEWQNVSGLIEVAPDWLQGHIEVARQGAVYVFASAQRQGIVTLKAEDPAWVPDIPIPLSDPARYDPLHHPGDAYSFDIFSQIAQAARDGKLLNGQVPTQIIGIGESQSAGRLTAYINAVQKIANVFDGFLVHSSFGAAMGISLGGTTLTRIRDDLVPVLLFQSESDVMTSLGLTRQPESENGLFRLWEVAGTSHFDTYGLFTGTYDTGAGEGEVAALDLLFEPRAKVTLAGVDALTCSQGINSGPMHWVFNAALSWINRWVRDGMAPPIAPRLERKPWSLAAFKKDEHGNTQGGIRTPFVDVPLAEISGLGNNAAPNAGIISTFCFIFGHTLPFSREKLAELYPSHDDFVSRFRESTLEAVESSYLLPEDGAMLIEALENYDFSTRW